MTAEAGDFVDREEALALARELAERSAVKQILLIQGPDGIGKTALLEKLAAECRAAGIACAHVDLARHEYRNHPNFLSVATDIWCQLELGSLSDLNELVTARDGTGWPYPPPAAGPQPGGPGPAAGGAAGTAPREAVAAALSVRGAIDHIGARAQAAIGANISQIQNTFYQTFVRDDPTIVEPLIRRRVTQAFQGRLREACQRRRTLLLFDSWEDALSEQGGLKDPGAWICDDLLGFLFADGVRNCLPVIAAACDPGLDELARIVRPLDLGPLPAAAVQDYFARILKCDPADDALKQLAEISQGVPLAMLLLADGAKARQSAPEQAGAPAPRGEGADAIIGSALDRYLDSLSQLARQAVRVGAIPHRLDRGLLAKLGVGEPAIAEMVECSFIRWDADRQHFTYHQSVRKHLLRWWDARDRQEYRRLSRIALSWFGDLAAAATASQEPAYEFEREVLYHQLIEDDVAGFNDLATRFEAACDEYAIVRAQEYVSQALELHLRGLLTPGGRRWLEYFQARLKLLREQEDKGAAVFGDLAGQPSDRFLQNLARWNLGNVMVDQHRWSEGVKLLRDSLSGFEGLRQKRYAVRVMLSLGHAYCDLAQASGGLWQARGERRSRGGQVLHVMQHLPFLAYESLLRRNRWLPNWYFGTNYQNWIVAYLLTEGAKWYRRAEKEPGDGGTARSSFETQLPLAEIDYGLGRWSRARERCARLLDALPPAEGPNYRRAQVYLGRGRVLFDEQHYAAAESDLQDAYQAFVTFQDVRSAGETAELLGQVAAAQRRPVEAVAAYGQSLAAYARVDDVLAATRAASLLEDLAAEPDLPAKAAAAAEQLSGQVTTRQYVLRFPDKLLRWFRRLAMGAALPLAFLMTLALGVALVISAQVAEGELLLWLRGWSQGTPLSDVLRLIAIATLPIFLPLWLYRFVYMMTGTAVVRIIGRSLSPIEQAQPRLITCDNAGVTVQNTGKEQEPTVGWSEVADFAPVHYSLHKQPIELISSSVLLPRSGSSVTLDAVTSGYNHLVRYVRGRLGLAPAQAGRGTLVLLDKRWVLATLAVAAAASIFLVAAGFVEAYYGVKDSDKEVFAPITAVLFALVPMWILLHSAVFLWRVAWYQRWVGKRYLLQQRSIPIWLVVLIALVLSLATAAWFIALLEAHG